MSHDPNAAYYDAGGIETLDILRAKLTDEQYRGFLLGNNLKYLCRLNYKEGGAAAARDAEKAAVYAGLLAAALREEAPSPLVGEGLDEGADPPPATNTASPWP